jgi:hypothetical protein
MHPSEYLGRSKQAAAPAMSDADKAERLSILGEAIAKKRKEAVDARKASGIEDTWMAAEEAYLGIDDSNRSEFAGAKWAKPTTMGAGLTPTNSKVDPTRSNAFVRLTSRYADSAAAKLGEILLPIDEKAFSFEPTPDPDLTKQLGDKTPMVGPDGQPVMHQPPAPEVPPAPATPDGQPVPPPPQPTGPVPMTAADQAQKQMDQASDCATKAETRIYDWMVESKYPAEARKVVHDGARIGVGVLKGPFPDLKSSRALVHGKLQVKKTLKPSSCWVDPWNIFPDDACGENIHDGDYIFERDYLSSKMLKKLGEQDGYLADQIKQVIEEGPGKCNVDGASATDKKTRKRFEIWYYYGVISRDDMSLAGAIGIDEIPEDQEEVHAIISLVNDTVIRAIINPLDSGSFPYRVMTWSRRPGHWAGVGVAELIVTAQRTVNASTRSLFNNAGLSAGVQIVINQLGVIPADGNYTITPNKIWFAANDMVDVAKAFQVITIPSVQQEMMAIIEYGMKQAEESSGIPLITQGQTGPSSPDTFGQAELQDDNAHTWLRSIGYRFDDMITEPLVNDYYEWLLLDPNVPDDEKGDFKINAHGSIALVERAIQEGTLLGLLKAAENPAFKVNPAKLFAEYLKAKRLDPRKIQYSDEEQAEMAKQPPAPPLPIMLEQVKGQNKMQQIQASAKAEMVVAQQGLVHEQQMLQSGGAAPHQAAAMAKVEQERIRSETAQVVEQSRASAEAARAQKEYEIAQQNGQFRIQEMQLQREIAILEYTNKQKITLQDAQAQLAQTAMQEKTKRSLAAAEVELAASEGDKNRGLDLHKHATSLVRDELSIPGTP